MTTRSLFSAGIALLFVAGIAAAAGPPAKSDQPPKAAVIEFTGAIGPRLEHYLTRCLEAARDSGVNLVILKIESPGGYLISSMNIANQLLDVGWAKTVAYIPNEALSGAAIVSLGCDEIVMQPRAKLGDAGLITMGNDGYFRYAPEKQRSDLARTIRDLAEENGRSPALAEAMVDMELIVHEVKNRETGATAYMSDREIEATGKPDQWEKVRRVLESGDKRFLEVNGLRAVELGLASATVDGDRELLRRFDVRDEPKKFRFGGADWAVYILNWPVVTILLFVIGLIALYVELSSPGICIGGVISAVCFALFFWSRVLGGTAGWLEVVLFVTGLILLLVELFLIPGFGVTGVTGILLMVVSVVMASQRFVIPHSGKDVAVLGSSLFVVAVSGVIVTIAAYFLSQHFGKVPVLNQLALAPPPADDEPFVDEFGKPIGPVESPPFAIGDWGTADSPLRPAGKALFADRYLDVVTDGSFVERGRQVRIIEIQGNRIVVRAVD